MLSIVAPRPWTAHTLLPLALINRHHKHHALLVDDVINQPIPAAAQLDPAAVRQSMQAIGFNARIGRNRRQLLLELLAHGLLPQFVSIL